MRRFQWTKLRKSQALCMCGAVGMFLLAGAVQGQEGILLDGSRVARRGYGQGEEIYSLMVDGVGEEELMLTFPVAERRFTEEEANQIFPLAFEQLLGIVQGENTSLGEVREDLTFPSQVEDYGIRAVWQTENPQLIDSFGQVRNEALEEAGIDTEISVSLSSGELRREYSFTVHVMPPLYTEAEKRRNEFQKYLEELDEDQSSQEFLELPDTYEGKPISYREEQESDNYIILLLGAAACAALAYRETAEAKQKKQRRERQMLLDYSEIVSKLTVYLTAGMGTKGAWNLIAREYEEHVKSGGRKPRAAYEEMCRTAYQMQSGTPEGKAYRMFGERCGLRPYQKLSALLEQNMRTGTRGMKHLLEEEMAAALEQRKDLAKRQGEEAGTKLLMPLFMMLGIVMVMIVVPAWMSFSI